MNRAKKIVSDSEEHLSDERLIVSTSAIKCNKVDKITGFLSLNTWDNVSTQLNKNIPQKYCNFTHLNVKKVTFWVVFQAHMTNFNGRRFSNVKNRCFPLNSPSGADLTLVSVCSLTAVYYWPWVDVMDVPEVAKVACCLWIMVTHAV